MSIATAPIVEYIASAIVDADCEGTAGDEEGCEKDCRGLHVGNYLVT